ncbi:TylF/MycF/NovP-related O-methyltransferase [Cohnella sp.]|uniref:TylF/MycF/NovP-related O-methyltransferase n=1 Tax=Cohnella sp. TaxID=1883426 RepID=UPI0035653C04
MTPDQSINEEFIIFGTGSLQKRFIEDCPNLQVKYYLDNDPLKWGELHKNKIIKNLNDCNLDELKNFKILIASSYYSSISSQLTSIGLIENVNYFHAYLYAPRKIAKKYFRIHDDMEDEFYDIYIQCMSYTGTSVERMYALYQSIKHIVSIDIEGDIVECGVWRGGSMMLCALTLKQLNCVNRKLYLYDTYSGMPMPNKIDINHAGESAIDKWLEHNGEHWCESPISEVKINMKKTGYPADNIIFIEGLVEDTIPNVIPSKVALLRLDTDFYESTYHELKYLFPILSCNGIIILDDYGHWNGAKEAIDKYISENNLKLLLHKIDYTGRIAQKA